MAIEDAVAHLNAAMRSLELEAYRGSDLSHMQRVDGFTIAEELKRIDCALGPKGESMFGRMADNIVECYVELQAALLALSDKAKEGRG